MGWNGKNDVLVMIFLSFASSALIAVLVGIIVPIIFNMKNCRFSVVKTIILLFVWMCSGIYILRCVYKKNEKTKE